MTNETVLTDAEIIAIGHQDSSIEPGENGYILPIAFARAIEQAVLKSDQVQARKRDAERYRWLTQDAYIAECYTDKGTILEVAGTDRQVPIDDTVGVSIDAAMEQKNDQ